MFFPDEIKSFALEVNIHRSVQSQMNCLQEVSLNDLAPLCGKIQDQGL